MREPLVVLTTTGSTRQAKHLARLLLHHRVAGCINILPQARSLYWWKGKLEEARENLLLIKTSRKHLVSLTKLLKSHHPYEVPELIALPILWGDRDYVKWLGKCLKKP